MQKDDFLCLRVWAKKGKEFFDFFYKDFVQFFKGSLINALDELIIFRLSQISYGDEMRFCIKHLTIHPVFIQSFNIVLPKCSDQNVPSYRNRTSLQTANGDILFYFIYKGGSLVWTTFYIALLRPNIFGILSNK